MTMAPLVVKDKILVGNSGGEYGVRGWLTALDANTGAIAWRAYSTGSDDDVLIGPSFHPFYAGDRGKDLGKSPASISSITARPTPGRGIPRSGPATTSGHPASLRETPQPDRRAGSIS